MTPALDSAADTELARVLGEFADRLGRGETPDPEDYAARFPHLAGALRELRSVVGLLPKAAAGDAPPAVSGFRIVREVGRGGMGVVYEAVEEALGRRVALKALPPQAVAHPQSLDRFRREAQAAARLHHTHIVPVFGVGEQAGVHYYVMQFVEGESLAGFLARGAAPPAGEPRSRFAARVGRQVADALAYAHAQGVLHRDVKPANVLLDPAGQPYLTDFGLAKLAGGDDLTATGDFVGTLRYAAPEQLRNEFDERGDVYGLGATLYELVTGRPPFAGDRESLVKQIATAEPPRPRGGARPGPGGF
jgi:serine/threonine protein kinase